MKDAGSALMGIGRATRREPRRRGRPAGHREPAPRARHPRRPGHPLEHHRLVEPVAVRGQRGGRGDQGGRRPRGQHHLRHELQRAPRRRGHGHGHRDRLRRRQEAPRVAARGDRGHGQRGLRPGAPTSATSSRSCSASASRRRGAPFTRRSTTTRPRPSRRRPRVERTVGEPPASQADDLRRRRPRDPELPAPQQVTARRPSAGEVDR